MTKLHDGTYWVRQGRTGAPAVVLIHGLGLNHQVWQWMRPELEDTYDVISYDLYGHGESKPPPDTPSLSLFSRQLADILDAADISKAAIIGFSLGGMICRRFAQDYPSRASALVILNSPHQRTADAQAAILKRVDQAATNGPSSTVDAALERWFTTPFRTSNPELMSLVRTWVLANDKLIYPTIYRVLANGVDEIVAPAPRLNLPALAMTADEDFGNGPEMTEAIAKEIDGGKALILEGLRHMALAENPPAVNMPVREFLDRVLAHEKET